MQIDFGRSRTYLKNDAIYVTNQSLWCWWGLIPGSLAWEAGEIVSHDTAAARHVSANKIYIISMLANIFVLSDFSISYTLQDDNQNGD